MCLAPGGIVFVMPGGYGAVLTERALDDVSPGELIGIGAGPPQATVRRAFVEYIA